MILDTLLDTKLMVMKTGTYDAIKFVRTDWGGESCVRKGHEAEEYAVGVHAGKTCTGVIFSVWCVWICSQFIA
jgi:hypothetical protein